MICNLQYLFYFLCRWQGSVNPVDGESAPLHASEPGHLAFGKLVDGNFQSAEHLVVAQLPGRIFSDIFVLQPIVGQVLSCNALSQQTAHLVDHALS